MPQDELWACSARLTGWQFSYRFDLKGGEHDLLSFDTWWSKTPRADTDGSFSLDIPIYCRDRVMALINVAHDELMGGIARNVPGVTRRELQQILLGFQEGALH